MSDSDSDSDTHFAQEVLRRAQLRREKLGLGRTTPAPIPIKESNSIAIDSESQSKEPDEFHLEAEKTKQLTSNPEETQYEIKDMEEDTDEEDPSSNSPMEMDQEENLEPSACPSIGSRGALKKLGLLYGDIQPDGGGPILDSPIRPHSIGEKTPEALSQLLKSATGGEAGRKSRFSALAKKLNDWEDDPRHVTTPTSRFNLNAAGGATSAGTTPGGKSVGRTPTTSKAGNSPVGKRLTVAAPSPVSSPSKRPATCMNSEESDSTAEIPGPPPSPSKFLFGTQPPVTAAPPKQLSPVAKKMPKLDTPASGPPTSVSVAARTRLFETSILESTMVKKKEPYELSVVQRAKLFEKQAKEAAAAAGIVSGTGPTPAPVQTIKRTEFKPQTQIEAPAPLKPIASQGGKVAEMRQFILSGQRPPDPESPQKSEPPRIVGQARKTPQKSAITSNPKAVSPEHPSLLQTKPIRVSPPKPGNMYPSLTDIESNTEETEGECESEAETSGATAASLGAIIERAAKNDAPQAAPGQPRFMSTPGGSTGASEELTEFTFSNTYAIEKIGEFIDEALEGQDDQDQEGMLESIMTEGNGSPVVSSSPIHRGHKKAPLENTLDFGILDASIIPHTPLQHSVSIYRKQREEPVTPRKPLNFEDSILEEEDEKNSSGNTSGTPSENGTHKQPEQKTKEQSMQERVKKLQDELDSQYRLISQASKAVNQCKSQIEFAESQQRVEAERALLITTLKRLALANEISRLRTEGTLNALRNISPTKHQLGPSSQGKITISSIGTQLKRDFLTNGLRGSQIHHFIGILKYRDWVEASPLVSFGDGITSTHITNGILHFPKSWTLRNLEPDFKLEFQVYWYRTMAEFLPHEAKYHIHPKGSKESKGLTLLTPKSKSKSADSKHGRLVVPQSPAGPDAVCSPSFELCGSLSIDITNLRSATWTLEGVRLTSPMEGSAMVELKCSAEDGIEQEGFLTLFTDVAGFGLWERRYCRLTPATLEWWIHPEDKGNDKDPVGSIPLHFCVTPLVRPAPREICARSNAFLLVTSRPPMEGDENSLIVSCKPEYTAIRHMICTDSPKERETWCKAINVTLANLRSWDPRAKAPDDSAF